jgi:predicted KAP-like P-loop ATPase
MNNANVYSFEVRFSNAKNNKCTKFGGSLCSETGWGFTQFGSFRSEYEHNFFNSKADFIKAIEKFFSNPNARIERFVVDGQRVMFDRNCSIGQGFAENVVRIIIDKVN